jgi:hypothetical protein
MFWISAIYTTYSREVDLHSTFRRTNVRLGTLVSGQLYLRDFLVDCVKTCNNFQALSPTTDLLDFPEHPLSQSSILIPKSNITQN